MVSPVGDCLVHRDHSSGHHRKGLPGATFAVPEVGGLAATQLGTVGDDGIGLAFGKRLRTLRFQRRKLGNPATKLGGQQENHRTKYLVYFPARHV